MKLNKFIVTVPVYNSIIWIEDCIDSIISQTYNNYDLIIIDDCSDDGTWDVLQRYRGIDNILLVRNRERIGSPLANIVKCINLSKAESEDIIINVDGDDRLSSLHVFNYLNWVYQDSMVYMTYGQYTSTRCHRCSEIPDTREYRRGKVWRADHLRTYKKWLWDQIKDEDLRDEDGEYYKIAGDCAFMYPLVEMCGKKHLKFIDRVLYLYNDNSYLNEKRVDFDKVRKTKDKIRAKEMYSELP